MFVSFVSFGVMASGAGGSGWALSAGVGMMEKNMPRILKNQSKKPVFGVAFWISPAAVAAGASVGAVQLKSA